MFLDYIFSLPRRFLALAVIMGICLSISSPTRHDLFTAIHLESPDKPKTLSQKIATESHEFHKTITHLANNTAHFFDETINPSPVEPPKNDVKAFLATIFDLIHAHRIISIIILAGFILLPSFLNCLVFLALISIGLAL